MGPGERVQNGLSRGERECVCARTEEWGGGQAELEGAWTAPGLKASPGCRLGCRSALSPAASDYAGRLSLRKSRSPHAFSAP